jgi:GntR family transcriptional regulator
MKLWLSKNSAIPVHHQLRTQLMLGITSGDLAAGDKLPSTSEVARRFRLHANTVRTVYRDLVKTRWAEWRRGSGFYVCRRRPVERLGEEELDRLIAVFMEMALASGYQPDEIRERVLAWIAMQPPDHILVIEPDSELRAILVAELHGGTRARTESADLEACANSRLLTRALVVAMPGQAEAVRAALPADMPLVTLKSRSIASTLIGRQRPGEDTPITVISSWPDFLRWAEIILTGVGLDPTAFDIRDARKKGWDRGLDRKTFLITDSLTATRVPAECKPIEFRIVSDESIEELKNRFCGRGQNRRATGKAAKAGP